MLLYAGRSGLLENHTDFITGLLDHWVSGVHVRLAAQSFIGAQSRMLECLEGREGEGGGWRLGEVVGMVEYKANSTTRSPGHSLGVANQCATGIISSIFSE